MAERPIDRLLAIMSRLRDPKDGCPWDREQTFASIAPYTVEEAYEVADAIERGDLSDLKDELGDLLFQVVFHARMAEEQGDFRFDDVVNGLCDKMVRRHPHVFADVNFADQTEQTAAWEAQKAEERAAKGAHRAGVLDDVPASLPGLTRAVKLTKRAARVGFDWPDLQSVMAKLHEEIGELEVEIEAGDLEKAREELGDFLFVCANLARKLDLDPESAIRTANTKFIRRFAHIEAELAKDGRTPSQSDLAEMDALWDDAKRVERSGL
jgi:tetrapyrrole methylase family protein/MazG family protein/ATP diphosphatase